MTKGKLYKVIFDNKENQINRHCLLPKRQGKRILVRGITRRYRMPSVQTPQFKF